MRKFFFLASTVATLAATTALPAGADTTATFTLTGGALSISAPVGIASLASPVASASSSSITTALGVVTVTDRRGGVTTWTASVISTAFIPTSGVEHPAINVSYATGAITMSATVVATPVATSNRTDVTTIVTGASTGISSANWNPSISVFVPANYAPSGYSVTITNSVA